MLHCLTCNSWESAWLFGLSWKWAHFPRSNPLISYSHPPTLDFSSFFLKIHLLLHSGYLCLSHHLKCQRGKFLSFQSIVHVSPEILKNPLFCLKPISHRVKVTALMWYIKFFVTWPESCKVSWYRHRNYLWTAQALHKMLGQTSWNGKGS